MRKRQDEILVVMIDHRKRKVVVVVFAMHGVAMEIVERVVHPTHVPFKRKSQPAQIRRTSHLRPGSRFLGNGHYARKLGVGDMVEGTHERNSFKVFAAAVLI